MLCKKIILMNVMMKKNVIQRVGVVAVAVWIALVMVSEIVSVATADEDPAPYCGQFSDDYSNAQALDVFLFIENSNEAYGEDPRGVERQGLAHMVADMLLVDGQIRGVEHRLAIWTYKAFPDEEFSLNPVSGVSIAEVHDKIDQIILRGGYVGENDHIENLFSDIGNRVKEADNTTVVLVINDMSPNGGESGDDFAQRAYDQWSNNQPANGKDAYIYMIDTTPIRLQSNSQAVSQAWQKQFFDPVDQGDLRTITRNNWLFELKRILEEGTGD